MGIKQWFNRQKPNINDKGEDTKESEPLGLFLLLIRPSLPKIFEDPPDKSLVDADVIMTSFGMYNAFGMNKHDLERIPTLGVSESGHVGYTIPMRSDLQLCLHQLVTEAEPPIDYPLGLFTNRDVIIVVDGLYTVMQMYHDAGRAMRHIEDETNEFLASKIIWAGTTINEGDMSNLRRLEATAEDLLTPEPAIPPKLSPEIASDLMHYFLEPIFKHVREKLEAELSDGT